MRVRSPWFAHAEPREAGAIARILELRARSAARSFLDARPGTYHRRTMAASTAPSKLYLWAGRVLTVLPTLLLAASGIAKITQQAPVVEQMVQKFGFQPDAIVPIGIVEVACAILYALPRTSALGAILVSAYLGGAVVTHLRVGDNFIPPIILAILAWGGLYCRDERVRGLLPLRR